jgi:hypothetical protein
MIISNKHKFIFIKTKKTAGSSVEKFLWDHLDKTNDICTGSIFDGTERIGPFIKNGNHISASWVMNHYPNEWKNYFKFTIVRNPWDTMVSFYYWYKNARNAIIARGNFEDFLNCVDLKQYNDWHRYTFNDKIIVDKVLLYENLHEEFTDIPVPYNDELLKVFVKSGYREIKDYRELYNDVTKKKVEIAFSNMIEQFNYKFS